MDVVGRESWDDATPLARGAPCLVARRRLNSRLDGDESAKGFWVASYTSARRAAGPGSADTLTACLKRPGFSEARFLWHRLGLAPADLDRKSREPQNRYALGRVRGAG
jgi:hypothetical protein